MKMQRGSSFDKRMFSLYPAPCEFGLCGTERRRRMYTLLRDRRFLILCRADGGQVEYQKDYLLTEGSIAALTFPLYVIEGLDGGTVVSTTFQDGLTYTSDSRSLWEAVDRPLNIEKLPDKLWEKLLTYAPDDTRERWKWIEEHGGLDEIRRLLQEGTAEQKSELLRGMGHHCVRAWWAVSDLQRMVVGVLEHTRRARAMSSPEAVAALTEIVSTETPLAINAAFSLGRLGTPMPLDLVED